MLIVASSATCYHLDMPRVLPVGSRRLNGKGYVQIKTLKGQRRWSFEHRVIWEAVHGPMPKGSSIHHIDGVITNNAIQNLQLVLSNSDHHRHYHNKRPKSHGEAVSRASKGRPKSPEHAAKIAAALKGKPKSAEHRANLSAAHLGRKRPDIAARLRGVKRTLTPEQREKLRLALASRRDPATGKIVRVATV